MRSPRRGEIYELKGKPGDDANKPKRPFLVVSRNELNAGAYCVGVPFYSQQLEKRKAYRSCVFFHAGDFGLKFDCVAKTDEISHIPIREISLSGGYLGQVSDERMSDIDKAIIYSLNLSSPPAPAVTGNEPASS